MSKDIIDKMTAEGWQQRFSASGARLAEAISNYRELGFEVKTLSMKELTDDGCTVCFADERDDTMMLFTRKINERKSE